MDAAGKRGDAVQFFLRIHLPHPAHFIVVTEVHDALDDEAGMLDRIDRGRINVPEEGRTARHCRLEVVGIGGDGRFH